MSKKTSNRAVGPIFVILGACLWGTESYFRVQLNKSFDADVIVFVEHLVCIFITLPIFLNSGQHLRGYSKKTWIYLLLSGSLGSAIGAYFFTESLRTLNASVANVLLNFQPLIAVFFSSLLLNERISNTVIFWGTLALAAGLMIVAGDFSLSQLQFDQGLLFLALTALSWGFSTVAGRGIMLEMPLKQATFLRFFVGGITLLALLLFKNKLGLIDTSNIVIHSKEFLGLGIVSGTLPLFFYFYGLAKTPASLAAFCEMTQTIAAVLLTWGVMGQSLTPQQCVGSAILLFAIYKLNSSKTHLPENMIGPS